MTLLRTWSKKILQLDHLGNAFALALHIFLFVCYFPMFLLLRMQYRSSLCNNRHVMGRFVQNSRKEGESRLASVATQKPFHHYQNTKLYILFSISISLSLYLRVVSDLHIQLFSYEQLNSCSQLFYLYYLTSSLGQLIRLIIATMEYLSYRQSSHCFC